MFLLHTVFISYLNNPFLTHTKRNAKGQYSSTIKIKAKLKMGFIRIN